MNNTDAEGRLVLADGVYYARTELNAAVVIDMATLTGAAQHATGTHHAALVTNCELWERRCVAAGLRSGDLIYPLVYAPDLHLADLTKSVVADMKNSNLGKMTVSNSHMRHFTTGGAGSADGRRGALHRPQPGRDVGVGRR